MKNVLEHLEHAAGQYPEKTAAIDENGSIKYTVLQENAQRVGSFLLSKGSGRVPFDEAKETLGQWDFCNPVPVLMEKGIPALTCFFGAVYAGSFYVLLNPDLPEARLKSIISVLEAPYLLTDEEHVELAERIADGGKVYTYERAVKEPIQLSDLDEVRNRMIDTDPLYANFTSGSTGTPKGVLVSHRAVIDFINIFTETFGMDETDVFANQAPFDFDVSVKDIYSSLKCGGTLVIVPKRLFSRPVELLDFLCAYPVTTMIWAVSALCLVTTFHGLDYKTPDSVKRVLFSGEVMPEKHLKQWLKHMPDTEFVNLYGPTEITCNCTYHRIDRSREYCGVIPIGKAFPNERVFLLDENSLVTEPGQVGEICVGGSELALGYYGNFEQTKSHFVQNPLNHRYPEIIYRTGDLGSFNENGEIVFKGRKDFQIKYQGHRIELEEIEAGMMAVEGVERSCCVFYEEKGRLFGFYVGSVDPLELERRMKEKMPLYMIPRKLTPVDEMPMTKNGKIDRKVLLEQALGRRRG